MKLLFSAKPFPGYSLLSFPLEQQDSRSPMCGPHPQRIDGDAQRSIGLESSMDRTIPDQP